MTALPATLAGPYSNAVMLSDADVEALVPMADAVERLERVFIEEARGAAKTVQRTQLRWEGGRIQALGGYLAESRCAGMKCWTVTPKGAQPTFVLFSTETGRVLAIMEATVMGRIRTGGMSALAIRQLTPEHASRLLVIGTGRQAMTQVAGALHAHRFADVRVAGRDPDRTTAFAERVSERFEVDCSPVTDVRAAAADAGVIIAITNSSSPVLTRDMVGPRTLINAMGAIVPHAIEVDPVLFADADRLVVDSVPQVLTESGEVRAAIEHHGLDQATLRPLHAVVACDEQHDAGLTVFKSLGVGIADVAVAELALRRSLEASGR